jgi:hypothetical protein
LADRISLHLDSNASCDGDVAEIAGLAGGEPRAATWLTGRFEFGTATADPGLYVVCWAAESGARVRVGRLTLAGPRLFEASCTFGLTCSLDLEGVELADSNVLSIVNGSCNQSAVREGLLPTDVWDGMTSIYDLSTQPTALPDPSYALCWRNHTSNLARTVYFGKLSVNGPRNTSIAGRIGNRIIITLSGVGLVGSNRLSIAAGGCTELVSYPGWKSFPLTVAADNVTYDLATALEGDIGNFSICWQHQSSSARLKLGDFNLRGELPKSDKISSAATLGCSAADAAAILESDSTDAFTTGLAGFLNIATNYIAVGDVGLSVRRARSLSDDGGVAVDFEITSEPGGMTLTVGTMLQEASAGGAAADAFMSSIGDGLASSGLQVTITGVSVAPPVVTFFALDDADFVCTLGLECSVALAGYPGNQTSDLLVLSTGRCPGVLAEDNYTRLSMRDFEPRVRGQKTGVAVTYRLGTPLEFAGTGYGMCFRGNRSWSNGTLFYNATLTLAGPTQNELECSLGADCVIEPQGVRLTTTNAVILSNGTCPPSVIPNFTGWVWPQPSNLIGEYLPGNAIGGERAGPYSVCWVHDRDYIPPSPAPTPQPTAAPTPRLNATIANRTNGSNGTNATASPTSSPSSAPTVAPTAAPTPAPTVFVDLFRAFDVAVGTLHVAGPWTATNLRCTLGEMCSITLTGYRLSAANRVVVRDGACEAGQINALWGGIVAPLGPLAPEPTAAPTLRLNASSANGTNGTNATASPTPSPSSAPTAAPAATPERLPGSVYVWEPWKGPPGIGYSLCWSPSGSVSFSITLPADADLYGPVQYMNDYVCTLGVQCTLVVEGLRLRRSNSMVFRETLSVLDDQHECRGAPVDIGAVNSSFFNGSVPVSGALNDTYHVGVPQKGIGRHSLCWSHNLRPHIVRIAGLVLVGPELLAVSCTLGLPCRVDLQGTDLSSRNVLIVASNCSHNVSIGYAFGVAGTINQTSPTSYDLGTMREETAVGDYTICWNFNATATNNAPASTNVALGPLALRGPFPDVQAYCPLGVPCTVLIRGIGLAASNRLVIAERCGTDEKLYANLSGLTNPVAPLSARIRNATFFFGTPVAGRPTYYSLCWAHGDGPLLVEVSRVWVAGPSPSDVRCTLGVPCVFTIDGSGLQFTDVVAIAHKDCSTTGWSGSPVAIHHGINATYELGIAPLVAGRYHICWSQERGGFVRVGAFLLAGPTLENFECTLGRICDINVSGFALEPASRAVIVDTPCGSWPPVKKVGDIEDVSAGEGATNGTNATNVTDVANVTAYYDDLDIRVINETNATNETNTTNATNATNATEYIQDFDFERATEVAIPTVKLPFPDHLADFLTADGLVQNANLSALNFTFGIASVAANVSFGSALFSPGVVIYGASRPYFLCWAHHPESYADFSVSIGDFVLRGPYLEGQFACTLRAPCELTIVGHGISSRSAVVVIGGGVAEGFDEPPPCLRGFPPAAWAVWNGSNPSAFPKRRDGAHVYDLGTIGHGIAADTYTVCWADAKSLPFVVEVGIFELFREFSGDHRCVLGRPCVIQLRGPGLAAENEIGVFRLPCADLLDTKDLREENVLVSALGMVNPVRGEKRAKGYDFHLGTPLDSISRTHVLCWASAPQNDTENYLADFYTEVDGAFVLAGPELPIDVVCTLGLPCIFSLAGVDLHDRNGVMILSRANYFFGKTVSFCGDPNAYIANWRGVENPEITVEGSNGTIYDMGMPYKGEAGTHHKLCWADSPFSMFDYTVTLDASMVLVGPLADTPICVLGLVCNTTLYGFGLEATNNVSIQLDRCGSASPSYPEIPGYVIPQAPSSLRHFPRKARVVTANGDTYVPSSQTFTFGQTWDFASVGEYKLCWGFSPSDASEYNFEVGPFVLSQYLEGPFFLATPEHNSSVLLDLDADATGVGFSQALGLPDDAMSVTFVRPAFVAAMPVPGVYARFRLDTSKAIGLLYREVWDALVSLTARDVSLPFNSASNFADTFLRIVPNWCDLGPWRPEAASLDDVDPKVGFAGGEVRFFNGPCAEEVQLAWDSDPHTVVANVSTDPLVMGEVGVILPHNFRIPSGASLLLTARVRDHHSPPGLLAIDDYFTEEYTGVVAGHFYVCTDCSLNADCGADETAVSRLIRPSPNVVREVRGPGMTRGADEIAAATGLPRAALALRFWARVVVNVQTPSGNFVPTVAAVATYRVDVVPTMLTKTEILRALQDPQNELRLPRDESTTSVARIRGVSTNLCSLGPWKARNASVFNDSDIHFREIGGEFSFEIGPCSDQVSLAFEASANSVERYRSPLTYVRLPNDTNATWRTVRGIVPNDTVVPVYGVEDAFPGRAHSEFFLRGHDAAGNQGVALGIFFNDTIVQPPVYEIADRLNFDETVSSTVYLQTSSDGLAAVLYEREAATSGIQYGLARAFGLPFTRVVVDRVMAGRSMRANDTDLDAFMGDEMVGENARRLALAVDILVDFSLFLRANETQGMIGYLHDLATHVTSDPRIALFCTEGLKRAQVPAAVSNIMMMDPETAEIVQPYVEPICFPGVDENCSARYYIPHVVAAHFDADGAGTSAPPVRFGDAVWEAEDVGPLLLLPAAYGVLVAVSTPRMGSAQAYWPAAHGSPVAPANPLPAFSHIAGVELAQKALLISEVDVLGGDLRFAIAGPPATVTLCTMGLSCTVALPAMPETSVFLVQEGSCGSRFVKALQIVGWENPNPALEDGRYLLGLGKGGMPGEYKMCWGFGTNTLELTAEAGKILIAGPGPQRVACDLNIHCAFNVTGVGLAWSNQVFILEIGEECGSIVGPFLPGLTNPVGRAGANTTYSAEYSFLYSAGTDYSDYALGVAHGGRRAVYPLCWAFFPSEMWEIMVSVGTFSLRGPEANSVATVCYLGLNCAFTLEGLDLAKTNAVSAVMNGTCGDHNTKLLPFYGADGGIYPNPLRVYDDWVHGKADTYNWGRLAGSISGTWTLCWAAAPATLSSGLLALYKLTLGTIDIFGPDALFPTCTLGIWCEITITGRGLGLTNWARVVQGLCVAESELAPLERFLNPTQVQQQTPGYGHYVFGYPWSGLPHWGYSLCWAKQNIVPDEPFAARIGDMTISGPYTQDFTCTLGVPCIFDVIGVSLSPSNQIMIISAGVCGLSNSRAETAFVGIPNPVTSPGNPYVYEIGTLTDGKATRDGYKLCWAHDPQPGSAFKFFFGLTMGVFGVLGPGRDGMLASESANTLCYRGLTCTVDFFGIELQNYNKLIIIQSGQTCGDPGVLLEEQLQQPIDCLEEYVGEFRIVIPRYFECPDGSTENVCEFPICWAHDPGNSADYSGKYSTFIGIVSMLKSPLEDDERLL